MGTRLVGVDSANPRLPAVVNKATAPYVDVKDYGAVGDGVADDSAALNAAANYARGLSANYGPTIMVPRGLTVRIASQVNLRYLHVQIMSPVVVDFTGSPGLVIGGSSASGVHYQVNIVQALSSAGGIPADPSIRIVGVKNGYMKIGQCDYLQLYADANVATDTSIAYSQFRFGRKINKLELLGQNGVAWINENAFYGGSYDQILLSGSYAHNSNMFVKPSVEAGAITLNVGAENVFEDVRTEGGCNVTFAAGTRHNVVVESYTATTAAVGPSSTVVDAGDENCVTTRIATTMQSTEVFRLDRNTKLFNASSEYSMPANLPSPGFRKLGVVSSGSIVFDSGLIPLSETGGSNITESSSRVTRFHLASDSACWRPTVEVFDSSRVRLDSSAANYINLVGGWSGSSTTWYTFGSDQSAARIVPQNAAVAFIRIRLYTTATKNFEWVSITAQKQGFGLDGIASLFRRQIQRPLYQAAAPTKGLAYLGESIGHATGRFTCVARADTTLSVAAVATNTTITVTSATGMASGDLIGVLLDTGLTHWTTINGAPAGAVVTLTVAMPSAAAIGNDVATNRWVSIT